MKIRERILKFYKFQAWWQLVKYWVVYAGPWPDEVGFAKRGSDRLF